MEERDKILDYTKPVRLPDDCGKNRKNFTQGYFYREIGRYKNAVPSEFQWAAEDKLINKNKYEELKCQLPDSPRSTFLMVFSPDGKKVASTHGNHNVYVSDLTTGRNIQTLTGHPRTPWCIAFHPSSNQILASGCLGGQVRVWDLHGGSEVWTAESQTVISSIAFHPVDRMLVIATYNELHFWDWSQPEPFAKCSTKSGREKVRYVSFDHLGNKLITGIAIPVNVPSQWDRISVVNSQPPVTSTTTSTTNVNSPPSTTVATSQASSDLRYLTSWYRNFMNRYNQLINLSRNTPTIDRGTDPMDLLDLRSNGNGPESSTSNSSPSTSSNSQTHSSSPLRFKITRSACRSYRPLNSRERFRIHSSVFRRLSNRSTSALTTSTTTTTTTSGSQTSVFSTPSTSNSPSASPPPTPRLRRCAFSLCPTARSWCLTLSPENSSGLLSSRYSSQSRRSRAVTNLTYTSSSDRGILSTRESSSSSSDRSQFSVVRPYRLLFEDTEDRSTTQRNGQSEGSSNRIGAESAQRQTLSMNSGGSPSRDSVINSPEGAEIERELQRPNSERRLESETNVSSAGESASRELSRNSRSSVFQLSPVDLRNVSPVRRFRESTTSDGELTGSERRENPSVLESLMHPRPLPRFQVRSRLLDEQSQLHLITSRETHGLNLQNNQALRRQLSFRPGGQFVLSRHSNSPFQPRVPHYIDSPTSVKNNLHGVRPEIPSLRSSFTTSISSNTTETVTSTTSSASAPTSTGNSFSVASNLSFSGEPSSRQLPEQINRRLFDRVKMMLRDRIRNSSENAATDSTVNYSRISGESEPEPRTLLDSSLESEEGQARGLGPRGADPMLSSASENLDTSNDGLLLSGSGHSSPIPETANGLPSSNGLSQLDLLDPWESETDTVPFSLSSSLSMHDILNEQPLNSQESGSQVLTERGGQNQSTSTANNERRGGSSSSPEFSMRQGIQLLSLHIENMQRLCLARIEILQLQKIRSMWEDLTNQIRCFHNTIQNRTARENFSSSAPAAENSNSNGNIASMRNLAISSSPVPESNPQTSNSSETSNDTSVINGYKELVESMVNELLIDSKKPKASKREKPASSASSRNETEEPQPGPSGLSTPNASRSVRNSILHLEYRVYKLLRDIIQKTRRREGREAGASTSSGLHRQNCFRIRNSLRSRFRRHLLDSSLHRVPSWELEAIWQAWKNERLANKSNQSTPSTSNVEGSQTPSTSAPRNSSTSLSCQSCGQKKKPSRESSRQKRRSVDSFSGLHSSASKALKNNVGERSEAPSRDPPPEEVPSTSADAAAASTSTSTPSSSSQESSTNELLKQMLQTMETMLRFQREAFRRTKELTGRPTRQPQSSPVTSDDSDSDHNNSNEHSEDFMRDLLVNFRSTREVIRNSMQDIAQIRAKRLLWFMVRSLNKFFGKNFSNLNQVLDEQIFSLYMLLDLALELTDLLLDQLNARSRDLERNWSADNYNSFPTRERNYLLTRAPTAAGRLRERNRIFGRSFYNSPYSASREDNLRYRLLTNQFLHAHSRLISTRLGSSGPLNAGQDRLSNPAFHSYSRRRRKTARMSTSLPIGWYSRYGRTSSQSNSSGNNLGGSNRAGNGNSGSGQFRSFRFDRRSSGDSEQSNSRIRGLNYEINNNSSINDTNNNYNINDAGNNNNNNNNNSNHNNNHNNNNNHNINSNNNNDNRSTGSAGNSDNSSNNNINSNFLNYYFSNNNNSSTSSEATNNNIIIVTSLNNSSDIINNGSNRTGNNEVNNSRQSGSNSSFLNQNPLPPLRSMELTLSRNDNVDLSLRDERPIFWIRYGGNNETSGSSNSSDSSSRVSGFTVPVVQVNDVPVSADVSLLNQPRYRPQSPGLRVPEDFYRWRAWRPRFLHPRYGGPNPFDDQDSNDVPENIHYYRILSTSAGSHLGVYTFDPMIVTDASISPHHRIQAWDFSKMNIPDISDREANGVVPECKIHNDASVDVSKDGHLLATLLPSGRFSITTMLGVYSLDWSSLGQLLYRTSFEQSAVSVSLSPTNRHLVVGLASRPAVARDRTNMAQIFRLEGGRPSPQGGSWQSGRGRLVHMRDIEQARQTDIISLNCIRWAPGAGQGLVYGTNTGLLNVLR